MKRIPKPKWKPGPQCNAWWHNSRLQHRIYTDLPTWGRRITPGRRCEARRGRRDWCENPSPSTWCRSCRHASWMAASEIPVTEACRRRAIATAPPWASPSSCRTRCGCCCCSSPQTCGLTLLSLPLEVVATEFPLADPRCCLALCLLRLFFGTPAVVVSILV